MTPKQELFCQTYVEIGNASEAHRLTGYGPNMTDKTRNEAASRLLGDSKIKARIKELQQKHEDRHDVTVDSLTRKLEDALTLAIKNDQPSAAVSAIAAMARIHGHSDKDRPVRFDLPKISDVDSALDAMAGVVNAVSNGELTPNEGKSVSGLIETYRRCMETADLKQRIEALEARG